MKSFSPRTLSLTAGALVTAGALGLAQIERLTLAQMVAKADNAVAGTITNSEVIRIDHPIDGSELYFTHLTIEGQSLVDGADLTVVVTFAGGWIDETHGVNNSEAPAADEIKKGNRVVAFYSWMPNMGGDLAANALYASHGGLYQVVKGRSGSIVLGKGEGYAVSTNIGLSELGTQISALAENK